MNDEQLYGLDVDEMEFLAEDEIVQIIPTFRLANSLEFISGKFGPFTPSVPTEVPLWLAIQLKKANKCRIKIPRWMQLENLQELYRQEQEDERYFKSIPKHYLEVASILLQYAEKDIINAARIRSTLADIESTRMNKIRSGLKQIRTGTTFIKLNNISLMELNSIHPICATALNMFTKLAAEERSLVEELKNEELVDTTDVIETTQNRPLRGRGRLLQAQTDEIEFEGAETTNNNDEMIDGDNDDTFDNDNDEDEQPQRKLRRFR